MFHYQCIIIIVVSLSSSENSGEIVVMRSAPTPLEYLYHPGNLRDFLSWLGGTGGGSPGEQGVGGVRETGQERAGSGISTMAEAGEKFKKKVSFRYLLMLIIQSKKRPQQHFLTSS